MIETNPTNVIFQMLNHIVETQKCQNKILCEILHKEHNIKIDEIYNWLKPCDPLPVKCENCEHDEITE